MALFLVTGPTGSGKSTLIRALTGRADAEYCADITDGPTHLIERSKRQDVWASTTSEETAAILRPHAAREYTVRNLGAERCADLHRQIAELQAKLAEAQGQNFNDTPRAVPGAPSWETATDKPIRPPQTGSRLAGLLANFKARRLAGNLEGYAQTDAAQKFGDGSKSVQSAIHALYRSGHLERRKPTADGPYYYRARS